MGFERWKVNDGLFLFENEGQMMIRLITLISLVAVALKYIEK